MGFVKRTQGEIQESESGDELLRDAETTPADDKAEFTDDQTPETT